MVQSVGKGNGKKDEHEKDNGIDDNPNPFEVMAFDFIKHINKKNITSPYAGHPLLRDETAIDPKYTRDLLQDVEQLRGGVAEMVSDIDKINCQHFFMYFVNKFQTLSRDFTQLLNASGESLLTESQIRTFLGNLQRTFLKILAIYEVFELDEYPEYKYIEKYLNEYRNQVLVKIFYELEEYNKKDKLDLEPGDKFHGDQLTEFLNLFNLNIIRTLFSYLTIYKFSKLEPSTRKYITDSIARILLLTNKVQERMDLSSKTVHMKPDDLLHNLYQTFSELKIFINFTKNFASKYVYKTVIPETYPSHPILETNAQEVKGVIELFSSRKCVVCQAFFSSELWEFIQELSHQLSLQIIAYDTYLPTDEAWCKGVYGITKVPTMKFHDKSYWINPEMENEKKDPHQTVKREILNFFEVLGVYRNTLDDDGSETRKIERGIDQRQ